jgi:glycosyltransferase involved in cell wall biosynthesis
MKDNNQQSGDKQLSICFVGLDNYAFFRPDLNLAHMGGEAVQQSLLAREFVSKGHAVSTIVLDNGQTDGSFVDGINIINANKPGAGIKGLRFFHPNITSIWKGLSRADADVYYQSPAGMLTGITAAYCRLHKKRFVFRIASDANCVPGEQLIRFWRDRKIFEYGMRAANIRAVQTRKQQSLLSGNYGLNSVVVKMMAEPPETDDERPKTIDVLWVNGLRGVKRPDRVVQLAQMLPDYKFVMIGGPTRESGGLFSRIEGEAAEIANLEFLGSRSYSYVNDCISRSKLLLNTSDLEGFPNTFLQAWIRGVPTVTMFDPDDLVASRGLGAATSKIEDVPGLIEKFLANDQLLADCSSKVLKFARQEFSPEVVLRQYLELVA